MCTQRYLIEFIDNRCAAYRRNDSTQQQTRVNFLPNWVILMKRVPHQYSGNTKKKKMLIQYSAKRCSISLHIYYAAASHNNNQFENEWKKTNSNLKQRAVKKNRIGRWKVEWGMWWKCGRMAAAPNYALAKNWYLVEPGVIGTMGAAINCATLHWTKVIVKCLMRTCDICCALVFVSVPTNQFISKLSESLL